MLGHPQPGGRPDTPAPGKVGVQPTRKDAVTDSDTPVPRRALGVAGSADEDPAVDTPHRPSRAIWPSDPDDDDDWDDDEPVTLTGLRGILPEPAQSTPVPPPAPVLPSSVTASQQSAYRPRFSAVSSTSPAEPPAPRLPDPPVVAAASRQATPEATTADLETGRPEPTSAGRSFWADRRQRMVALVVIGVAVLALIAALVATSWSTPANRSRPSPRTRWPRRWPRRWAAVVPSQPAPARPR